MRVDLLEIPTNPAHCILLIQAVSDEMCVEIRETGFYDDHLCEILQYYNAMLPKLIAKELGE